jgi:hypothetical protein
VTQKFAFFILTKREKAAASRLFFPLSLFKRTICAGSALSEQEKDGQIYRTQATTFLCVAIVLAQLIRERRKTYKLITITPGNSFTVFLH